MAESSQLKNLLLLVVFVFVLFFALMVFPPLAALIGIFSPLPIVFVYLQRGRQVSVVLIALVFVVLLLLVGTNQALLFLTEYALMALLLGEMIRIQAPSDKCIAVSASASGLASIVLLIVLFGDPYASVREFFEAQIRGHFSQSMEAFEAIGENKAEVADMKAFAERTIEGFAAAYPAFLLIGSLIASLINYSLIRIVWTRLRGPGLFSDETFAEWFCPENMVWGFILSAAALFLGQGVVADVGLNVFLVVLVIYFVQGLSIVVYFLKARNVPVFFWVVLFILIFAQPILTGLVAGLGVFDIWVDFRKLKKVSDIQ